MVFLAAVRGLKPTATIVVSLREMGRKCPNSRVLIVKRDTKIPYIMKENFQDISHTSLAKEILKVVQNAESQSKDKDKKDK